MSMLGEECYQTVRHDPHLTWEDMYRHVLRHFREQGLRFAFVDTGLDDPHLPARRAYEAVGFDRQAPVVEYRQNLTRNNPGSEIS